MEEFYKLYSDGQEASEVFFGGDWSHTINILVRVTIRAAIFQTDCNLESRCFCRPYISELQLSNIEVIKA